MNTRIMETIKLHIKLLNEFTDRNLYMKHDDNNNNNNNNDDNNNNNKVK